MLRRVLRTLSLIVFIFLCINFSCILKAEDDNTNAADLYTRARTSLVGFRKDINKDKYEDYDTKAMKIFDIIKNGWKGGNIDLKEILNKNKESITEFKEATKITQCEFNFQGTIEEMHNRYNDSKMYHVLGISRLVLIEGRLYEEENKFNLALENYFSVLQFANHLSRQEKVTQQFKMIELILRDYAYFPLAEIINEKNLTSQDYKLILGRLISLRNEKVGLENKYEEWKEVMKYYKRMQVEKYIKENKQDIIRHNKNYLRAFFKEYDALSDEFYPRFIVSFKKNNAEDMIKQFEKEYGIDKAKAKCGKVYNDMWNNPIMGFIRSLTITPSENAKSEFSWDVFVPKYINEITRYYVQQAQLDLLILTTAIKLYEAENGKSISSLDELVPKYIPEIPKDPFNNFNSLNYEKKDGGWIIFSLGQGRQNNHGVPQYDAYDSTRWKENIVFSSIIKH